VCKYMQTPRRRRPSWRYSSSASTRKQTGNDCPTVWVDDVTGDFVLKGWKITDPAMLAEAAPDHREVVMRFPARMAQFVQEVAGARRGPAV
jgi:hypothetical protein